MKSLVIYFSRADQNYFGGGLKYVEKGNTEVIAEYIKDVLNADLFKVERKTDYSKDYYTCIEEAKTEQKNGERPELKRALSSVSDYDVIFVGAPVYWGTMPQPMFTQLEKLDFNGKTVMPFTTHEGSGLGSVVYDVKKIAKGAVVKEGLAVTGSRVYSAKPEVLNWINKSIK